GNPPSSRPPMPTPPHTCRGDQPPPRRAAPRKLDTQNPLRVQAAVTMSGPFRENIKKLVERLAGGVAAVLMGFDGITVDSFAKSGPADVLRDIQTMAMELAHLIAQARRTLQ